MLNPNRVTMDNDHEFTVEPSAEHASYHVLVRENVLAIVDRDEGRSVTNDAAHVIETLALRGYSVDRYLILYRDTAGMWDGIATINGVFSGFIALQDKHYEHALALYREKVRADDPHVS